MKDKITQDSSLEDIAALVCEHLSNAGINVVLTGGAVVSLYTENEYQSFDLDFIILGLSKKVDVVMKTLGFVKNAGRHFIHPNSKFFVEFPGSTLAIGNSLKTEIVERKSDFGTLKLLSPSDCVKDRLAAFYHWNDRQGLDQAVAVAKKQPISVDLIKKWPHEEGMDKKFKIFVTALKTNKQLTETIQWRLCPVGQHWRSEHIQKTYTRSDGTVVHEHKVGAGCCENPSKKDQIYSDELMEIARRNFSKMMGPPAFNDLGFGKGNAFDNYIRGWTQFWNDILIAKDPLDPNLVKALIATESGFRPDKDTKIPGTKEYARGLLQVTDSSRRILGDSKGELKDHLIHIDLKDIHDANLNIAAGIRWMFHKKELASDRLRRTANWDEAIAEYKGLLKKMIKDPKFVPQPMKDLRKYYLRLNDK